MPFIQMRKGCGFRRRGRVLRVKFGYNPNSSSLGMDVTLILLGSALVSTAIAVISAIVRIKARSRNFEDGRPEGEGGEES